MKIECVLAIHNEESYLRYTLPSLDKLPMDNFVIVLDRCSDNSERLVGTLRKPRVLVRNPKMNWLNKIAETRQVAMNHLRGDFVLVSDADVIIDSKAVMRASHILENCGTDVVCFTYRQYCLHGSCFDRFRDEVANLFVSWTRKLKVHPVRTGIYLAKRSKLSYVDCPSEYDTLQQKLRAKWIKTCTVHLRPRYSRNAQLQRGQARATLPQYSFWKVVVASLLTLEPYVIKGFLEAKPRR